MKAWAEKVHKLKAQLKLLTDTSQAIRQEMLPLQSQIEKLQEQLKPFWEKVSPIDEKIHKLSWKLEIAEAWAMIEGLKEGDKIWIQASIFGDPSVYNTVSEDRAKFRLGIVAKEKAEGKHVKGIPRSLTIQEVKENHIFIGLDERHMKYCGDVEMQHWAQEGKPKLTWRRIK